jgi:hypothetical protein
MQQLKAAADAKAPLTQQQKQPPKLMQQRTPPQQ